MTHLKRKTRKEFKPGRGYTEEDWDAVESPELTDEQIGQGRPFKEALPGLYESIQRSRGRPKIANPREAVTLRVSPQTIEKFKAAGEDWRARMVDALEKAKVER